MKQSDRIAALEAAVTQLQEEVTKLKGAPIENTTQVNVVGKWAFQIMVDEGVWEWYSDVSTGNKVLYDTKEDAENAAKVNWKFYRAVKLG
jgi:hypothetical protein